MGGVVVVGVDSSEPSRRALRWALEEARLRGAALRVVHAWWAYPEFATGQPITAYDWDTVRAEAARFVEGFVEQTVGTPDDVEITSVAPHGTAAPALVAAAAGADLLVVGSRGYGGLAGVLLGSVSQQCAQHAPCPVAIVRGAPAEKAETQGAAAAGRGPLRA